MMFIGLFVERWLIDGHVMVVDVLILTHKMLHTSKIFAKFGWFLAFTSRLLEHRLWDDRVMTIVALDWLKAIKVTNKGVAVGTYTTSR